MRIAAMAAGAVGGYFAARMQAAGHEVFYIARGANLRAMRKNGLKIASAFGDLTLPKVNVTDDPKTVGPVDIVIFAVKLWDTEQAAELSRPMIGTGTRVITLQNGVDSVERIAPILGAEQTVGGTTYVFSVIAAPGVIRQTGAFARVNFGRPDKKPDPRLDAFLAAAKAAKIDAANVPDIERELWQKFVLLTATSGATAALRSPIGPIVADPELRAFFRQLMEETFAVGKAKGVDLDHAYIDERMEFAVNKMDRNLKASMANDLDRGNRLELDWLSGKVRALGRALDVPTPAHDTVWTVLNLHRMGAAPR
jgi:2-dehydropantoate 2-reductase